MNLLMSNTLGERMITAPCINKEDPDYNESDDEDDYEFYEDSNDLSENQN